MGVIRPLAAQGHLDVAALLLDRRADILAIILRTRGTPLHTAAANGRVDMSEERMCMLWMM